MSLAAFVLKPHKPRVADSEAKRQPHAKRRAIARRQERSLKMSERIAR